MNIDAPPANISDFAIVLGKYGTRFAKRTLFEQILDDFPAFDVLLFLLFAASAHEHLPK
jgi:hypothetical protein